jgi:hypothetical protein
MLYDVSNPKLVLKEIKKLKPLNYNRFYWWRRWDRPTKDLPKSATFLDRIKNGEFEFSHYYWQAIYCEMEINEKYSLYKGDIQKLLENDGVAFQRRKKLWEDFEKVEKETMNSLRDNFMTQFEITRDQYEEIIGEFDGTTEELYYYIRKNFDHTGKTHKKRGRPPKK